MDLYTAMIREGDGRKKRAQRNTTAASFHVQIKHVFSISIQRHILYLDSVLKEVSLQRKLVF